MNTSTIRSVIAASALILAAVACHRDYQSAYAGNIPLGVSNRASEAIEVFIMPADGTYRSKRWGEPIRPGQTATYRIKPGSYEVTIATGGSSSKQSSYMLEVVDATDLVVADSKVHVPPNAQLVVLGEAAEGGGGEGGGGEGGDSGEDEDCEPPGSVVSYNIECCSMEAECFKDCDDGTVSDNYRCG